MLITKFIVCVLKGLYAFRYIFLLNLELSPIPLLSAWEYSAFAVKTSKISSIFCKPKFFTFSIFQTYWVYTFFDLVKCYFSIHG